MVHQDSVVGDDGSHRLLVVPCALVVLVLVLMVTACSSVGDEASAGRSSGEEQPNATAAAPPVGEGVDEPVVTEDGRMIQPTGHTGLWFETEPPDPLEKLVFESQRFVGHPVALEPIGERALLPQWEDMPDPCHPEVIRRMEELGFEALERGEVGPGQVQCAMVPNPSEQMISMEVRGVIWGTQYQIEKVIPDGRLEQSNYSRYEYVDSGELAESVGCFSVKRLTKDDYSLRATHSNSGGMDECKGSEKMLQVIVNSIGGKVV
ncbi:hypothetical protein [Corynebacterium sp. CNJ-954]|uniref:hypothetical protein n=1 Tax=Corynebacterium sp. CNJ-954 TaxID=1904962 RepID=UPI0011151E32|nr:hypothetical protein [Corynebacterium sp. CNJ-954]